MPPAGEFRGCGWVVPPTVPRALEGAPSAGGAAPKCQVATSANLTDSDWDQIAGKKDQFPGKLRERYGYTREQAERDLDEWDRTRNQASP